MFRRFVRDNVLAALGDTPVVLLVGPRQSGKSTLAAELLDEREPRAYVTLDDAATLAAARNDPTGFLAGLSGPVCIDEIQRAPELFLPLKANVDRDRRPGRFLLTGSADVLAMPAIADALAGRIEILTLWPLAQAEIGGSSANVVDALFDGEPLAPAGRATWAEAKSGVVERALAGGFPPAIERADPERRRAWFSAYVTTMLDRDVRDLAAIDGLRTLPNLLHVIAARSSGLLSYADLATSIGVSQPTVKRYVTLLERLFLVRTIPAWSRGLGVRLTKSPKVFVGDSGLSAHLLGVDAERISKDPSLSGPLLETFGALELVKLASWSRHRPAIHHFRTSDGREVDAVLEAASGDVVGIEFKAGATVGADDLRGLRALEAVAAGRLKAGVLFYTGMDVVPFAANVAAVPFTRLWRSATVRSGRFRPS